MKKINAITAVSQESPTSFHIKNGLVLDQLGKNERISRNTSNDRFLNQLKKNNIFDKPLFNYSDIKDQNFDYHSIYPSKAVDLSCGVSAGLRSLTPYNKGYSRFLEQGFGKRRGQFTVQATQSKVSRVGLKEFQFLSNRKFKLSKRDYSAEKIIENRVATKRYEKRTQTKSTEKVMPQIECLQDIDDFERKLEGHLKKSNKCSQYWKGLYN